MDIIKLGVSFSDHKGDNSNKKKKKKKLPIQDDSHFLFDIGPDPSGNSKHG